MLICVFLLPSIGHGSLAVVSFVQPREAQQKNTLAQLLRNFVPGCRLARKSFPQFLNYLPVVSGAAGDGTVKRRTTRNRQKMD